jgi:hypothetical protein
MVTQRDQDGGIITLIIAVSLTRVLAAMEEKSVMAT